MADAAAKRHEDGDRVGDDDLGGPTSQRDTEADARAEEIQASSDDLTAGKDGPIGLARGERGLG